MKNLFFYTIIGIVMVCTTVHAQSFHFPSRDYADSTNLPKAIAALAKQLVPLHTDMSTEENQDLLFRFKMAAEDFSGAIKTLSEGNENYKTQEPRDYNLIGYQFMTYCVAKLNADSSMPFATIYRKTFDSMYNALSDSSKTVASQFFDSNIKALHDRFFKLLDGQKTKDSISLDDAKLLVRTYNSYNVYSQVLPIALPIIAQAERDKFIIEDSVLIKMRDGATLSAVVVRRKNVTERLPVLYMSNIYNSDRRDIGKAEEMAMAGYVGVVGNTRGRRLSPQTIEPFEHDATDAYDVIDWISKQPWCNGKVGMFGGSYLGFAQWAAVKKMHPALKTIVPQVAVGIGIDYPMTNNVNMSYMLRWIHYVTNNKETDQADFSNTAHWDSVFRKWYVSGKPFRSLDTIEGRPNTIYQRWLQHPAHDAYWQNMVPYKQDFANINIPILTITGYYDADQLGALYYFRQHQLYNKNANHHLVIGPYDHGGAQNGGPSSTLSGYTIDSVANISIKNLVYGWFDYILKDSAKPSILEDNINYQVMGTNQWKHAPTLTKLNNDTMHLYLSNIRSGSNYKLFTTKPTSAEYIHQQVDFASRADTMNSRKEDTNILDSTLTVGELLSFTTDPIEKPFAINGSFFGEIKTMVNKKDLDLTIELYEQLPNGKYFFLSNFLGRASYAKDRSKRQLLKPNTLETIPYSNSFFSSRLVEKGSRLLILVGVIKTKYWQLNYGSGKEVSDETIADGKIPMDIKWFNNSVINLPVMN